jgi:hypothetical protein
MPSTRTMAMANANAPANNAQPPHCPGAMPWTRTANRPAASSGERSPESKSKQGLISRSLHKPQACTGTRWSPCPLPAVGLFATPSTCD